MAKITTKYENGKKYEVFNVNAQGKKHGLYESFYENGILFESRNYENGLLNGIAIKNYSNGQKGIEIEYNFNTVVSMKKYNEFGIEM